MTPPEVHRTREYNRFKILEFNRDISDSHLEHLKELIRKENLLKFHPIVVNDSFEVIDGQHRLMVARDLGLDIFYIKGDVSYSHVLNTNLIQKNTNLKDVIKYYAKRGYSDYIDLERFAKDLEIAHRPAIALLGIAMDGGVQDETIHLGKFKFPKDRTFVDNISYYYLRLKDIAKKYKIRPKGIFNGYSFCSALNTIYNQDIDMDRLMEKVENKWFELKPNGKKSAWFDSLIAIYNYKSTANKIEIKFSDILKLKQKNK